MAKLHFIYSTMNAGKSSQLLQTEFNYRERGMTCLLFTAAADNRSGVGVIASRLGISAKAEIFTPQDDMFQKCLEVSTREEISCVLIDEAQFLTRAQVAQLCDFVDNINIPVMAYGLRTDFKGHLFEGSAALMALANEIREMRTICHCGKKAIMVLRKDEHGHPTLTGPQVQIGGNDTYEAVCRHHWSQAHEYKHRNPLAYKD